MIINKINKTKSGEAGVTREKSPVLGWAQGMVIPMAERIQWGRIRHAYECGTLSYKDLAKKYHISLSRLTEVAKSEDWVGLRKRHRHEVGALAASRLRAREAEKLASVKTAADELAEQLAEVLKNKDQMYLHAAVVRDARGEDHIRSEKLDAINPQTLRAFTAATNDLTKAIRNLYDLQTAQEEQAQKLAAERLALEQARLELERERLALEKAKSGDDEGARAMEIVMDPELKEMDG